MKEVSSELDTHIGLETTSLAICFKLKPVKGTILAATTLDKNVPFDLLDGDGVISYKAETGYDRTALSNSGDFSVGNMELRGLLAAAAVTKEDIRAEIYDFAEMKIFQVNWKDLSQKELKMARTLLGQISIKDEMFVVELRDLLDLFNTPIGDLVVEDCPIDLFDGKCRVQQLPVAWAPGVLYVVTNPQAAEIGSYITAEETSTILLEVGSDTLLLEDGSGGLELEDGSGIILIEDGTDSLVLENGLGNFLIESLFSNRIFRCTVGGTSDATIPAFNLTIGGLTVESGGVTWETLQANQNFVRVTAISVARRVFTVEGTSVAMDAPDIHYEEGTVEFQTGSNNRLPKRREVKTWTLSSGTVELWRPMPFDVVVGDIILMAAGCTKTSARCVQFFNRHNHRGWTKVPGMNKMVEAPRASA